MTDKTTPAKPQFKRLAEVTVPQLKIDKGIDYYIKFAGPIHLGQQLPDKVTADPKTGEVTKETPKRAHVAYVMDLEVMAPRMIVVSAVMVSELERGYPGEGYIGKSFGFKSQGKINGKGYNTIEVWEVEEPEGVPEMRIAPGVLNGSLHAPDDNPGAMVSIPVSEAEAASAETKVAKPKK